MKVALDISKMNKGSFGRGIGTYAQNLAEAVNKYTDVDLRIIEGSSKEKFDLVHFPYFDFFSLTLPVRLRYPSIVTIHDCTPLLFPEHYPPGLRGKIKQSIQMLSLKQVKAVLTDSESSRKDIITYLKVDPRNVFVTLLAPSETFRRIQDKSKLEKVKEKYNIPDNFAVYIGSVNWNKNLPNLAKACIEAGINLVLVGKDFEKRGKLNHPELESFNIFLKEYLPNPLVKALGYVPDEELPSITTLASCALLPSFYEGFGLPILQAQRCDVPVITSNVSSMPEIAGGGAILINPEDYRQIKDAIIKLKEDLAFRMDLIKKGRENILKYSWRITAEKTVEVYRKVLYEN